MFIFSSHCLRFLRLSLLLFHSPGVVNASVGQLNDSTEHTTKAQQYFQLVGGSASECDTIPGRQCMASCFFLLKQFEDVLIYLNSVKAYSYNDSIFNFNYGMALASCGNYKEAEEALLLVSDENYREEYVYLSWLARCFIMNGKPREAWELYLKLASNTDSFALLVLISNDCYKCGSFYYAAKALDVLERLDPSMEYWEVGRRCRTFPHQCLRARTDVHPYAASIPVSGVHICLFLPSVFGFWMYYS